MTRDYFLDRVKSLYGDRYTYSNIPDNVKTSDDISINCSEHGLFIKNVNKHLNCNQGCPGCSGKFRYNTESFIEKAKSLEHCNKMSFELVNYKSNKDKVIITCHCVDAEGNEHGNFEISPGHLFSGEGCPKCRYVKSASSLRRSINDVIKEARIVHGDKYDYSLINEYKNDRIKYEIICPEHGVFKQTMNNHIKGKQGCSKCGRKGVMMKEK